MVSRGVGRESLGGDGGGDDGASETYDRKEHVIMRDLPHIKSP